MKIFSAIILFILIPFIAPAQEKLLSLDDIYLRYVSNFYPKNLAQLQWQPGNENYTFVDSDKLVQNSARKENRKIILSLHELNGTIGWNKPAFPKIDWLDANRFYFSKNDTFVIYNSSLKAIDSQIILPNGADHVDFNEINKKIAFTSDSNLFISDIEGSLKLTSDGGKGISYGTSVHRNEFGITKGTFWSPKGNLLAFYRMDETMVTDYPLVDITARVAKVKNIKYPMAGMASHQVKVGVYNLKNNTTVYLETGKPLDHYLTNIAWSPDEKYVYIALLNREQNHMWMNQYDAATGKLVKTLFEEQSDKYVEPLDPIYFLGDGSNRFLWQSRRDGYNHIYLYASDGTLLKQLTSGAWEVTDILKITAKGDIFFSATIGSPIEEHLCSVNVKTGKIVKITNEAGVHQSLLSDDGKYVLDTWSSLKNPRETDLLSSNGKTVKKILVADNPLKDYKLGEQTVSTILANDGKTPLYYRMIKPVNFDASKKYPVIVYLYGGPHLQLVRNEWPGPTGLWQQYLAEHGIVSFTIDNRGSEHRGLAFESIIHRHVGQIEMQDQIEGVRFLKSLGYVDSTRIGVHGWSFGGFLTTSLMVNYPGVYKVAVAGGPVMDWRYYEVMYGERYMDTPQENPEGYELTSCLNKSQNLKGKLLIIHGAMDPTVVWQNSLLFLQSCIKNNKQVDYFVYPTHEHNVIGKDRLHLMEKVTGYFTDFL